MATQMTWNVGSEELSSPEALKASLAELIATALFVLFGVGSIASMILTAPDLGGGIVIIAAAHGLAIAVLVAGIGSISGGHINPAVSFAMVITGRISVVRGAMYIVAQLAGAVIGMALLKAFLDTAVFDAIPGAGGHAINEGTVPSTLAAVGIEATMTFLLVWTVFATAVSPRGVGSMAPVYIGFAYFVFQLVAIPLTGAGANPARTFGPALVAGEWTDHWVYWVGPLIGAAIASLGFTFIYLTPDDDV